jgi:hypothetical protein
MPFAHIASFYQWRGDRQAAFYYRLVANTLLSWARN